MCLGIRRRQHGVNIPEGKIALRGQCRCKSCPVAFEKNASKSKLEIGAAGEHDWDASRVCFPGGREGWGKQVISRGHNYPAREP